MNVLRLASRPTDSARGKEEKIAFSPRGRLFEMKMDKQRWQQIETLYHAALERAPGERAAFLADACADDSGLLREVEELLRYDGTADRFMQDNALAVAAQALEPNELSQTAPSMIGRQLNHYKVLSLLGAGGMGEVYRARDARLGREVAIKVLPAAFAQDADQLRRFEQEARAAGLLNHPNILVIYDIGAASAESGGAPYIVSELLEGETLRSRLKRSVPGWREAVEHGLAIADGLAAAHEKGIVHRDLKPENLFITKDGRVKILDFGLAKLKPQQPAGGVDSQAPTQRPLTDPGVIMGTVGYMSPEQLRGEETEAPSDIFSFGCVLYEMMAGQRAFARPTAAETMAAILTDDPPEIAATVKDIPPALEHVIGRCLEKRPEERFQSARDLASDLKAVLSGSKIASSGFRRQSWQSRIGSRSKSVIVFLAMLAVAVTAIGAYRLITLYQAGANPSYPFAKMTMSRLTSSGKVPKVAISPDGKLVAYVEAAAEGQSLWVRQLATSSSLRIMSPIQAEYLALTFSPDSDYVYCVIFKGNQAKTELYQAPVFGGPSRKLPTVSNSALGFSPDGQRFAFIVSEGGATHLKIANKDGGQEKTLAIRQAPNSFYIYSSPAWSPDGKIIACAARRTDSKGQYFSVVGVRAADGAEVTLTSERWLWVGQLAWLSDGSGLVMDANDLATASDEVWYLSTRGGEVRKITNDLDEYNSVSLRTDSEVIAAVQIKVVSSLWVAPNGDPNSARQIASEVSSSESISWTPDRRIIIYRSSAFGSSNLWVIEPDETGARQLTTDASAHERGLSEASAHESGLSVSSDGRHIVFTARRAGNFSIWRVDIDGGNLKQLTSGNDALYPRFSPDGQWVVVEA